MFEYPNFKGAELNHMAITQPGAGGINLKDLVFQQNDIQSPYMLNMMYRNGAFSKRYGQAVYQELPGNVISSAVFRNAGIIQLENGDIYKVEETATKLGTVTANKATFVHFNKLLYIIVPPSDTYGGDMYQYDGNELKAIVPYVPDIIINRRPDGKTGVEPEGTNIEQFNRLSNAWSVTYHGNGTSKEYLLPYQNLDATLPKVEISGQATTAFTYDATAGKVTFTTAPPEGTNNVKITAYKSDEEYIKNRKEILKNTVYVAYGGNNASRLLLAGGGDSRYYYSDVYDATNFPDGNYAQIGNTSDDITGFGLQYNVCIVFKPREIYSLSYYVQSSTNTTDEDEIGKGAFTSQLVNASMGCDACHTIQLINNQLTWFSSTFGVCTLASTNIQDERNVKQISRNIDRGNEMGVQGILDIDLNENGTSIANTVMSVDFENKYFIVFPKQYKKIDNAYSVVDCGLAYVWDYELSPYINYQTNPKNLAWFLFDNMYVNRFDLVDEYLMYSSTKEGFKDKIILLNDTFYDLDFNGDGERDSITAYYMTPFLQFGAVGCLKTVKNLYIQCRGDTASIIDVYYYTDESSVPEKDPESIRIGDKMWKHFSWETFEWFITNWANTFRRKCSLKKIQLASFFFRNDQPGRDMSITHIGLQYQIVKWVK